MKICIFPFRFHCKLSIMSANVTLTCSTNTSFLYNKDSRINYIFLIISTTLLALLIVILNSLFLFIMQRSKNRLLLSDKLLMMLAVTDLLSGVITLPLFAYTVYYYTQQKLTCKVADFNRIAGYTLSSMSVMSITFIVMDVYIAVLHPFFYQRHVQSNKTIVLLLGTWMFWLLFCIIAEWTLTWKIFTTCAGVVIVIMLICLTFWVIKLHIIIRKISCKNQLEKNPMVKVSKSLKMAVTVLGMYSFCYLPIAALNVRNGIKKNSSTVRTYALLWCQFIALSNSFWNTLVYYFRLRKVRRELIRLLCGRTPERRTPSTSAAVINTIL